MRRSTPCCTTRQAPTGAFAGRRVHTSRLQRLGIGQRGFRRLLPLFPPAAERLDVQGHDLLISSSSAFAHGVRPAAGGDSRVLLLHARSATPGTSATGRSRRCPRAAFAPVLGRALSTDPAVGRRGVGARDRLHRRSRSSPASESPSATAATPPWSTPRWTRTASRSARPRTSCWWSPSWCATSASRSHWRPPGGRTGRSRS